MSVMKKQLRFWSSILLLLRKMSKRYYLIAMLLCLILLISACKKTGAATGTAPRTPFIGGTAGITMGFEKGNPPPEVTDDGSFEFNAIVRLKNDGEFTVDKSQIKLNLIGFDPGDFSLGGFDGLRNVEPEAKLEPRRRGAEGDIIEGTTTFATFPRDGFFTPVEFVGNTEFTFRAEACYNYRTQAFAKLCVLRDMVNVKDNSICKPNGAKTIQSSSAPVQVSNLKQNVIGKDKLSFSFDIILNGNVDIFSDIEKPSTGFDIACPKEPRQRRQVENKVTVQVIESPSDPILINTKCGGLGNSKQGEVFLVDGKRTIICTAELVSDREDLERGIAVDVSYNVLDDKETKVLVKHLAEP